MEEQGGTNLYGFCSNNSATKFDILGLSPLSRASRIGLSTHWGNIVREKKPWAKVYKYYKSPSKVTEASPIWEELAIANKLSYVDKNKWVKGYNPLPDSGDIFFVPNTFVTYSAGFEETKINGIKTFIGYVTEKMGLHDGERDSGGIMMLSRRRMEIIRERLKKENVNIISYENCFDNQLFRRLWKTDGIFGVGFIGHGAGEDDKWFGFLAEGSESTYIDPKEVSALIPYRLAFIVAYSCGAVEAGWAKLLADGGVFRGYSGVQRYYDSEKMFIKK